MSCRMYWRRVALPQWSRGINATETAQPRLAVTGGTAPQWSRGVSTAETTVFYEQDFQAR
jgi:hypothetical protein